MIYELHLHGTGTSTTIVRKNQLPRSTSTSSNNIASNTGASGKTSKETTLPSNLSKTCRQIRQEVNDVLYRKYVAKLHVCAYNKGKGVGKKIDTGTGAEEVRRKDMGYRLKPYDIHPFLGFRKVHIVIQSHRPLHIFEYGDTQRGSLGFMLSDWVGMLVAEWYAKPTSALKKEVYLEFRLDDCKVVGSSSFWPFTEPDREQPWFYVQAAHTFREMKKELEGRLPATCPIILTSNVEASVGHVYTRLDARGVQHIENGSPEGPVLWLENGRIVFSWSMRK